MITYNFCTLFDSNYLSRGLAMYHSLKKNCDNFHLYVFAFDDKAYDILYKLSYEHITIISLKEFENEQLLAVKLSRSRAEYCWTCTPYTILHVLKNYKVDNCTYIDADLFFYSSPKVLFDEMADKSVLITEHRFTPKYDRSKISGKYCVQFMVFKNNEDGLKVLNWWANACYDWCYDRYEDGKFGDQKYLDDWTTRFKGIVHELKHLGGGMAPWNIQQYEIADQKQVILKEIKTGNLFNAVFFHFHYVRFYEKDLVDLGWLNLDKQIINFFYGKYLDELDENLAIVKTIDPQFKEGLRPFSITQAEGLKEKLKIIFKLITRYNLFKVNQIRSN
jgi:hypothetical protein